MEHIGMDGHWTMEMDDPKPATFDPWVNSISNRRLAFYLPIHTEFLCFLAGLRGDEAVLEQMLQFRDFEWIDICIGLVKSLEGTGTRRQVKCAAKLFNFLGFTIKIHGLDTTNEGWAARGFSDEAIRIMRPMCVKLKWTERQIDEFKEQRNFKTRSQKELARLGYSKEETEVLLLYRCFFPSTRY